LDHLNTSVSASEVDKYLYLLPSQTTLKRKLAQTRAADRVSQRVAKPKPTGRPPGSGRRRCPLSRRSESDTAPDASGFQPRMHFDIAFHLQVSVKEPLLVLGLPNFTATLGRPIKLSVPASFVFKNGLPVV
jgi:hypothetical protein